MTDYPPPVADLLTIGKPNPRNNWPDYLARGFGPEHVPDLLRMVGDEELPRIDPSQSPAGWAPVHAWRVLGQLRAAEAVAGLLQLSDHLLESYSDWTLSELPAVFGLIGPDSLPALEAYLADPARKSMLRWNASDSIQMIAQKAPETRTVCVEILCRQLEKSADNDEEVSTGIISALLDLKAEEAIAVIERAYATGNVDEFFVGDLDFVREELGRPSKKPKQVAPPAPPKPAPAPHAPPAASSALPPALSPRARAERRRQAKKVNKGKRKKK
jgi:hypothetical protein